MSTVTTTRSGSTNTLNGDTANSNIHEDVLDYFVNEDRSETPLISIMGKTTDAKSYDHQWTVHNYNDPKVNAHAEGSTFSSADSNSIPRRRMGNATQIFKETVSVSRTAINVNTIGAMNQFAQDMKDRTVEMRRDMERQYTLYTKTASTVAPSTAVQLAAIKDLTGTRHAASIYAYGQTHVAAAGTLLAFDGSDTAGDSYTASSYKADGTTIVGANAAAVVLTEAKLTEVIDTMFDNGGKPDTMLVPTKMKTPLSKIFTGGGGSSSLSQRNIDSMEKRLNIAVTSVITEFGFNIAMIPSYIMQNFSNGANNLMFLDSKMIRRAVLDGVHDREVSNGVDGKEALITAEETLEVRNTQGVGFLYNVKAV